MILTRFEGAHRALEKLLLSYLESCRTVADSRSTAASSVHALGVTNWLRTKTTFPALSAHALSQVVTVAVVPTLTVTSRVQTSLHTLLPEIEHQ